MFSWKLHLEFTTCLGWMAAVLLPNSLKKYPRKHLSKPSTRVVAPLCNLFQGYKKDILITKQIPLYKGKGFTLVIHFSSRVIVMFSFSKNLSWQNKIFLALLCYSRSLVLGSWWDVRDVIMNLWPDGEKCDVCVRKTWRGKGPKKEESRLYKVVLICDVERRCLLEVHVFLLLR